MPDIKRKECRLVAADKKHQADQAGQRDQRGNRPLSYGGIASSEGSRNEKDQRQEEQVQGQVQYKIRLAAMTVQTPYHHRGKQNHQGKSIFIPVKRAPFVFKKVIDPVVAKDERIQE